MSKPRSSAGKKVNLLIDIQAKMQAGKGKGYEQWVTVHNLKEAAKTLLLLTKSGITDYDELAARAEHADELQKHEAAKAAFDALGGKAIPKVAQLSEEYAALLAEKKERYEEYKTARKEMIDFQTAKQNVDRILGTLPEQEKQKEQER